MTILLQWYNKTIIHYCYSGTTSVILPDYYNTTTLQMRSLSDVAHIRNLYYRPHRKGLSTMGPTHKDSSV
jgi:hypothetical protein